ncbi:MAG: hypothetical protein LW707_05840 [Sphingobacteriales bacterium]|nr:hypothetical protein [Sphingobacteriales bacterium]
MKRTVYDLRLYFAAFIPSSTCPYRFIIFEDSFSTKGIGPVVLTPYALLESFRISAVDGVTFEDLV